MSARQTSKLIFKLICIHVKIFTNPHEYYDKSVSCSFASFHKSIWTFWQIWMTLVRNMHKEYRKSAKIVTNLNDTSDKYTWRWQQINIIIVTNLDDISDKSTWIWLLICMNWLSFTRPCRSKYSYQFLRSKL